MMMVPRNAQCHGSRAVKKGETGAEDAGFGHDSSPSGRYRFLVVPQHFSSVDAGHGRDHVFIFTWSTQCERDMKVTT
jgi:hypothetical protein